MKRKYRGKEKISISTLGVAKREGVAHLSRTIHSIVMKDLMHGFLKPNIPILNSERGKRGKGRSNDSEGEGFDVL